MQLIDGDKKNEVKKMYLKNCGCLREMLAFACSNYACVDIYIIYICIYIYTGVYLRYALLALLS